MSQLPDKQTPTFSRRITLWPARPCHTFHIYLVKGTIFGKKMCVGRNTLFDPYLIPGNLNLATQLAARRPPTTPLGYGVAYTAHNWSLSVNISFDTACKVVPPAGYTQYYALE
jgi:hypothetical protein